MFKFILYGLLGGFLRRWFGGVLNHKKILGSRGFQTSIMLLTFLSIYIPYGDFLNYKKWILAIIISCWLQFQFWSRGHGCCFDIAHNPPEDYLK